jgi:general secretion pathway protein L
MLGDYLTWWATQMLGWLPPRFINRDRGIAHAVVVDATGDEAAEGVGIMLRRKRQDRKLGRFRLDGTASRALREALPVRGQPRTIVLQLPPELLLEREVVLPLAAEREPERVLAYEMDRITPFNSYEVFWTYAVERRDHARGRLHLRLSLVTRTAVEALMAALVQMGIGPTLLEVRNADGISRQIALQRPDSRHERLARQAFIVAASACGVLAVAAVALPFVLQSVALGRVDARMRAIGPLVAEAEALRHKIATNSASVDVIEAERVRVGDALEVLATLTGLLPDDTFLTDFAIRQGKLTLNGQSAAAVRLIAALSGDAAIRNPEFVAPVTRFDNRADLFAIRAEVAR